ncbi:MAG: transcription termination factor Rho, partial [Dehalococcoidia bacterium]|nr:transcription termination factor Rho [Dehalococcoidia bacterium]
MNLGELDGKNKQELITLAEELGLENGFNALSKSEIVFRMMQSYAEQQGYILASGVLDLINDGYGFLRQPNLKPSLNDVYVSQSQIRRFGLRTGDLVMGQVRPPKDSEKYYGLVRVERVNSLDADVTRSRPSFDNLTPVFPNVQLVLETNRDNLSTRLMDLISPIGRGQRGLIVS